MLSLAKYLSDIRELITQGYIKLLSYPVGVHNSEGQRDLETPKCNTVRCDSKFIPREQAAQRRATQIS